MTTAVATSTQQLNKMLKSKSVEDRISELLGKRAPQFAATVISISKQTHLAGCKPETILGAAMTAAALDLPVNQNLGFAHVVPYKNRGASEAQFQMGYKGFIQLALRSGQYVAINDVVIPEGCMKHYNPLTGELDIDFSLDKCNGATPDGYACYVEMINGFKKTVFWTHAKMEAHAKRYSQSYKKSFGPWKDNFEGMALKTVIKLTLSKYGMLSVDLQTALVNDQSVIDGVSGESDYKDNEGAMTAKDIEIEERFSDLDDRKDEVLPVLGEAYIEHLTPAFKVHGYESEKGDKAEWLEEVMGQIGSIEKLNNIVENVAKLAGKGAK